jgi:hypothetical protein
MCQSPKTAEEPSTATRRPLCRRSTPNSSPRNANSSWMTVPSGIRITALTIAVDHVGVPTSATEARSGVMANAAAYPVATTAAAPRPQRTPPAQVDRARPRSSSRNPASRATTATMPIRHSPTRMSGPGPTLLASTSVATSDNGTSTARTPATDSRHHVAVAFGRNPAGLTVLMVLFILTYVQQCSVRISV